MSEPLATTAKCIYPPSVVLSRTAGITLRRRITASLWGEMPYIQPMVQTGPKQKKSRSRWGITALRHL